jgi:hypothetical protein
MAVAIAGCGGWTQQNFDAGRSRGNEFERGLTVANAPTLVHHTLAGTVVAVLGNTIVMQQGSDVVAYDAATCPHADNGPCTPLWTRSNTTWGGSDGTHLVFDGPSGTTFEVTDVNRNLLWTGTAQPSEAGDEGFVKLGHVGFSGENLIVGADLYDGHGGTYETVNVFPVTGCGTGSCAPSRTFAHQQWSGWVAGGDTLLLIDEYLRPLTAWSMTTGASLWTTSESFAGGGGADSLRLRGSQVFMLRNAPNTGTAIFDLAGKNGCTGTPVVCSPVRILTKPGVIATSDHVTVIQLAAAGPSGTANRSLALYPSINSACTSPCGPLATTAPVTTWANQGLLSATVTANLVLTVAIPPAFTNRTFHLLAYDAALTSGCSGDPKICQPIADVAIPAGNSASANDPIVSGGRVYVTIPAPNPNDPPTTHVLSLPGDVG